MSIESIRARDATWVSECAEWVVGVERCGKAETEHGHGRRKRRHPYRAFVGADTRPEADRRALLAVAEAASALLEAVQLSIDPEDDPTALGTWSRGLRDALAALEVIR